MNDLAYKVILPFGKYKGKSLGFINDIDPSYIRWLATCDAMPGDLPEAARRILNGTSIDGLNLNYVNQPQNIKVEMYASKNDTIMVSFAYNSELLERFKFEIDGRKWNSEEKCWEVPFPQLPKMVTLFGGPKNITADARVKQLHREEISRRKLLDETRVKDDVDIQISLKLPLYNFQKVGVDFIDKAGGRALVADQLGLGKTAVAIGYSRYKNLKTLIICPKSVIIGWYREIERFTGHKATIWESSTKIGRVDAAFHLINYDIVEKRLDELKNLGFELLVCDEATYLKNRKTKRAKSILGDYKQRRKYPGIKTKHVVFLTGTPILNRPIEAFVLLNFLDNKRFNNFFHFIQKYGGWRGEKSRNLDDLHYRTKDLIIRRLKKNILTELPTKQRNDLYVELSSQEKKEYNDLLNNLFRKWRSLGKPSVAEMPAIQKYLISKKMPRVKEIIDEMLDQDRSILVYCCYIDPLKQLLSDYGDKAALLYGQMNKDERQKSIDALKSGSAKIGLFSIGAGAMGIDGLQHSIDTVLFLDRYWVPSIHEQAEDRLYRIGQTKQVSAFYVTCEDTIDVYMGDLLKEKQEMIDKVIDGQILNFNPDKSFFREFVKILRQNYSKQVELTNLVISDDPPVLE